MQEELEQARAAVRKMLATMIPGDEYFLVEFNDSPRIVCDLTDDLARIESALAGIRPRNWTALYDAVYLAMRQMRRARNARKALLILSDGGDNSSRYTEGEMKDAVREGDVTIYAVGLTGFGLIHRHLAILRTLAEQTGGALYRVSQTGELPEAVERVSSAIRNQYLLGYSSDRHSNDGQYRRIQVKLAPSLSRRLSVSWRSGYYAPDGR
jgi:Ca-activated chloride channel family protein